jgi:competence protein ComEA
MADPAPQPKDSPPHWRPRELFVLRRPDQAVIAFGLTLALVGMVAYWLVQGGPSGRLVEADSQPDQAAVFRVDINRAAWPELAELPGIGEILAKRIVDYRQQHGPFRDPDEIARVRGIGPKKLEAIKPYLLPIE